jgi:hypothetical protein
MSLRSHLVVINEIFEIGDHQFIWDGEMIHDMNTGMQFDRVSKISMPTLKFKSDVLSCNGDGYYLRFDSDAPEENIVINSVVSFNLGGHFYHVDKHRVTMTGITNNTGAIKLVQSYSFGEYSTIDMPGSHRFVNGILTVGKDRVKLIF